MKAWTAAVVNAIRAVKADQVGPRLQREFFENSRQPLNTTQYSGNYGSALRPGAG